MNESEASVGRRGVQAARRALACKVTHVTTGDPESTAWYASCPTCDLKPKFATLIAFETWATHHHCETR